MRSAPTIRRRSGAPWVRRFMVLAINVFARDPLLTYQLLAGLALASS